MVLVVGLCAGLAGWWWLRPPPSNSGCAPSLPPEAAVYRPLVVDVVVKVADPDPVVVQCVSYAGKLLVEGAGDWNGVPYYVFKTVSRFVDGRHTVVVAVIVAKDRIVAFPVVADRAAVVSVARPSPPPPRVPGK
jgi:hypothetical protein